MGVYIYSLRKKHKECDLMGITPIKVISFEFAYRDSHVWPGDPGHRAYAALVGRTKSNAIRAQAYYFDAAQDEYGTSDVPYYIVWGGFEDGNTVYETKKGFLPTIQADTQDLRNSNVIGKLFKVDRRWTIEMKCPGHIWNYESVKMGDFRNNQGLKNMQPARSCKRCDKFEYADRELQALYEQH